MATEASYNGPRCWVFTICWLGDNSYDRKALNQVHSDRSIGFAGNNIERIEIIINLDSVMLRAVHFEIQLCMGIMEELITCFDVMMLVGMLTIAHIQLYCIDS